MTALARISHKDLMRDCARRFEQDFSKGSEALKKFDAALTSIDARRGQIYYCAVLRASKERPSQVLDVRVVVQEDEKGTVLRRIVFAKDMSILLVSDQSRDPSKAYFYGHGKSPKIDPGDNWPS